jgi:hypothetical protein
VSFKALLLASSVFFQKEKSEEHHTRTHTWRSAKKSYLRRSENASLFDIPIHYGTQMMQYVHRQTDIH